MLKGFGQGRSAKADGFSKSQYGLPFAIGPVTRKDATEIDFGPDSCNIIHSLVRAAENCRAVGIFAMGDTCSDRQRCFQHDRIFLFSWLVERTTGPGNSS